MCIMKARCISLAVFSPQEMVSRGCLTKTMASHSADMLNMLRSQREAGMFCDITLRTNGQSYSAHRAVLAAVSDHFQEIFTDMDYSMKEDLDLTGKVTHLQTKFIQVLKFWLREPQGHSVSILRWFSYYWGFFWRLFSFETYSIFQITVFKYIKDSEHNKIFFILCTTNFYPRVYAGAKKYLKSNHLNFRLKSIWLKSCISQNLSIIVHLVKLVSQV